MGKRQIEMSINCLRHKLCLRGGFKTCRTKKQDIYAKAGRKMNVAKGCKVLLAFSGD